MKIFFIGIFVFLFSLAEVKIHKHKIHSERNNNIKQ